MKHYYGTFEAQDKADGTPVTNADVESNQIIQEGLRTTFPLDGIVSEELADVPNQSGRVWYIDPIDGTKGFIGRSDQFAVHIGLAENNMPVMGIVYKPTTNEYYFGVKGQGAYRVHPNGNHVKLGVSQKSEIELITAKDFLLNRFGQAVINALEPTKVFVSGSEGLRVMRVAEGIANLHLPDGPYKTSTWDLCAPQIIAEEAGALVKYVDGSPIEYRGQRRLGKSFVMASNEGLYQQVVGEMYKINPNLI
jgi:3'(2'), 5'-bisphosphate nucleotidase